MNFSVALIARNESKTLPRLMESLKEFQEKGGKVILVDTGSTDNTAEIARELGCEVHEVGEMFKRTVDADVAKQINTKFVFENEDPIVKEGDQYFDFAAARNYVAALCPTDHISMVDADEVYTAFDLEKLESIVSQGYEQIKYNFVYSHDQFGNEALKFETTALIGLL